MIIGRTNRTGAKSIPTRAPTPRAATGAALLCALALVGCAGGTGAAPTGATPSEASVPSSGRAAASGNATESSPARYASSKFGIPLTLAVAADLGSPPTDDTPGLLSWTALGNDNNRVRFLVPAEIYPPDAADPVPPPRDFLGYIKGLADHGGVYSDITTTTVDGVPATLLTAQATRGLDGSLGCPTIGADRADGCFGLQPELALRIAVMEVGGKPLLGWARTDSQNPDAAFLASFQEMLATVDFK